MSNGSTTTGSTHCTTMDADAETIDLRGCDTATGRGLDPRHGHSLPVVPEGREAKGFPKAGPVRVSSALKGVKKLGTDDCLMLKTLK